MKVSEQIEAKESGVREQRGCIKGPRMHYKPFKEGRDIMALEDMLSALCCRCKHNMQTGGGRQCFPIINARLNCEDKDRLYRFFDKEGGID